MSPLYHQSPHKGPQLLGRLGPATHTTRVKTSSPLGASSSAILTSLMGGSVFRPSACVQVISDWVIRSRTPRVYDFKHFTPFWGDPWLTFFMFLLFFFQCHHHALRLITSRMRGHLPIISPKNEIRHIKGKWESRGNRKIKFRKMIYMRFRVEWGVTCL